MKKLLVVLLLVVMASTAKAQFGNIVRQSVTNVAAPATPSTGTIMTIGVTGRYRIMVDCRNTGSQALGKFEIAAKTALAATSSNFFTTAGSFTTPIGVLVGASGDLTAMAANGRGWFVMDAIGLDTVIVSAGSATATPTTLTCTASGS